MNFSIELPINLTGLGNVGSGIIIELFERGLVPNIFPIGNVDFGYSKIPEGFKEWFEFCAGKALKSYKRSDPSIRIWHINGSHSKISDDATLYTVHELNSITDTEKNILNQYSRVLVPSNFSSQIFNSQGVKTEVCPNFFDPRLFFNQDVPKKGLEDVTIFSVLGKLEKRKATAKSIAAWIKRFGGNKKFRLNCHVFNHHLMNNIDPKNHIEAHCQIIERMTGLKMPWNVTFFGFQTREEFNMSLNAVDIDLGLSCGEGFGLPLLQTRCLGKKAVTLKAHAHIDYCSEEDSVFIEPSGLEDCYDGIFFQEGAPFNQGKIFSWDEDEAISAMEKAIDKKSPDKKVTEDLKKKFSVKNTVDILLNF